MTPKQEAFCLAYLETGNASEAYRRAYDAENMKPETVNRKAKALVDDGKIAARIAELQAERSEKTKINAEYVLTRLAEIDAMDVLDIMNEDMSLKPVTDWPKSWRRYLSGFEIAELFEGRGDDRKMVRILKKIKWPDKVKNLELLGKHVGVQAFKEKIEHSGEMTINVLPEDAAL